MAEQSRAQAAPAEDPGLTTDTHVAAHEFQSREPNPLQGH